MRPAASPAFRAKRAFRRATAPKLRSRSSNVCAADIMSITTRDASTNLWRTALVVLFSVLLLALGLAAWFIRAPLPRLDGTVTVTGLSAPVSIRRDDRGIAHIEAQTVDDALFAEGFACAQDRLWQMDTLRRQAEGRLSEFAGPGALDVDRRSEEHTSELQSRGHLVCRLLLEKKKKNNHSLTLQKKKKNKT